MTAASDVPDRRLRLADGRTLGYRIYGNPEGTPLVFLHGTPGARVKFIIGHHAGRVLDLALIAPDRWGYGLTDPHPAPSLSAFADDVAQLADHLGHARFAVGGISGGAPYACAVAARLPSRTVALALISPMGPIDGAVLTPPLPALQRFSFGVLPQRPRTVARIFRAFRFCARHAPYLALQLATLRSCRDDKALITQPAVSAPLLASFEEGLRPGMAGPITDLALFAAPWNIDFSAITSPTRLWMGTRDPTVPAAGVRALIERIPGCRLIELPDAGHFWVAANYAQVLTWIVAELRRDAAHAVSGP